VLTLFYVLYLVFDLWADILFFWNPSYTLFSFLIDLLIFIYIIGSIFDRVDYIKEKIKIFRAGTIALFVILMKLGVQVNKISLPLPLELFLQLLVLIFFFIFITLLVGIYTIFAHKEGKKS
jgi:hypothetical protein